ncbi:MAG: hypothetical protein A3J66_04150 [Candidatus Magasanikbacteria bacterium RIFCSPHIGHO2_02_FULL_47_14]|uniref:ABC transporter substrate-binding protein n=1 Tax=Candidatus Magasanikbacteria bacterium RIFCSPHIGHO2_02_FULL_47_14 TaxID=1798680 RepID=A0A1F6M3J8_9BACT|nr:MAG: hypothetical protein A3J66_04150 [Candidatus Magasanikbacteria bacterium RIFCSPHIGHO2_02_FULL_47_14]
MTVSMKNSWRQLILVGVVLMFAGAGCGMVNQKSPEQVGKDTPKVAATIFPLFDLVRQIGGNDVETQVIIDPNVSEHYFELTSGKLKQLQGTDFIFAIGQNLDNTWTEAISQNIPGSKVVDVSQGISIRPSHDEEEGPTDPHYWLSPANAPIIIDTITKELSALTPEHSEDFAARAKKLKQQIAEKDREWRVAIAALPAKDILTFHDAFYYFADHFGLNIVGTFEPFPGKEPTPKYLEEIQREIKQYNIQYLFLEPQLSQDSLRTFASDNNLNLGTLDPIGGLEGRESYVELIDFNVNQIVQSLQK